MERSISGPKPSFTHPVRQLVTMLIVIALVGAGAYFGFRVLQVVFFANVTLNSFIALVFAIGVISCFWQVMQVFQSVGWIEGFVQNRPGFQFTTAPRLLAPLTALLRTRGAQTQMQISTTSAQSILDSIGTRIDEARDITRYLGNLLIFLGLLGTFYGLATTVPAMVDTIRALAPKEGETGIQVFSKLMGGLEAQLGGMGTAFSSSLLGLAGSLVIGLLELFAGHGQNRFYRELEEWMSSITRLSLSVGEGDGPADTAAVVQMLDQVADQMGALEELYGQADISRALVDEKIGALGDVIGRLATRMEAESGTAAALTRVADGQDKLIAALMAAEGGAHSDAESRMRMRSIDVQLLRILEEISAGRQESMTDLRADLSALTAAVRQLSRSTVGRG